MYSCCHDYTFCERLKGIAESLRAITRESVRKPLLSGGPSTPPTAHRYLTTRTFIRCRLSVWKYPEGQDVELLKARRHAEHHLPMVCVVQVAPSSGMAHASGIPPNNVEVSACIDASLGVPLHLRWSSVVHRRREDSHHSGRRV